MKTFKRQILINNTPENVFDYMDNIANTGMHMTERSVMMMGSNLKLEQLSENARGLNSKFRWFGKTLGLKMDFTILVTKWIRNREKVWETIGKSKMIILGWYQMKLLLSPQGESTKVELSIAYTKPGNFFLWFISTLLGPWYAKWCLNNMVQDSKKNLDKS